MSQAENELQCLALNIEKIRLAIQKRIKEIYSDSLDIDAKAIWTYELRANILGDIGKIMEEINS